MRKTRAVGLTALAAAAALVISACSGTPGQSTTSSTDAATSGSAAASSGAESSAASSGAALPGADQVGKVGGSACGIPHGPYDAPASTGGEVRVAWNDPLLSFNKNSSRGNATANNNIMYMTNAGFSYYDKDLNYINNDQFGTCEVVSLDPLTVKYTVNEGVTFSDGVQIGAADMILSWGALSGKYNDGEAVIDDEGNLTPGAGVAFDAADPSSALITEFPVIGDDGRSATFKWSEFYVDYQTGNPVTEIATLMPAHVVAKNALGIADPVAGNQAIIDAFQAGDKAKIKPIADFWNTGFDSDQLPTDPDIYLSTGPYKVTAYQQRAAITMERNPEYKWGPQPIADKITYLIVGDPTAAVQALTNEEVDIIAPQATADIYQAVAGLKDRGVEVKTGNEGTYEHVDLVFTNGGPFDPAKYGGDAEKALKVRQAFLKTIPRQDILDRLIKPINPEAVLRNSFTQVPGSPAYDQIVAENGMEAADAVDIPGAQALLTEAGVTGPIDVRLKFAANNPRRANEYDLMKASALQAGFNLIDASSPSWGQELPSNNLYDASLFGWQTEAVAVADTGPNFQTDGQNNYGGFSNPDVDTAYQKLQSTPLEAEAQTQELITVEKALVDNAFGTTIFQFPQVVGWNTNKVTNVDAIPLAPAVFYNFWDWEPVS
jgi:peptide/nickel transport system substrate-binding protein